MKQITSSALSARIINCLQTILELEPVLRRMDSGRMMLSEFKMLKIFLNGMDTVSLQEDEVTRIEKATERFLQELKTPVSRALQSGTKSVTLQ